MDGVAAASATDVRVSKLGASLGAEIEGVDLTRPLSDAAFTAIHDAFIEHQILVFRGQDITQDQHMRFSERFGPLTIHPFAAALPDRPEMIVLDNDGDNPPLTTDQWHSDEMFRVEPPMATILHAKICPPFGGDTLFASMTAAYEGLSDHMQRFISGLEAVHDFKTFRTVFRNTREGRQRLVEMEEMCPNPTHPIVRVHPESGKKLVYVSPQTTLRIRGMSDWESQRILDLLYHLPEIPEYQFRVQWRPLTVVMWDNRSTQHYAARDYLPHRRRVERVTVKGDLPIGVTPNMRTYTGKDKTAGRADEDRSRIKRDELARPFEHLWKTPR